MLQSALLFVSTCTHQSCLSVVRFIASPYLGRVAARILYHFSAGAYGSGAFLQKEMNSRVQVGVLAASRRLRFAEPSRRAVPLDGQC